MGKVHQVKDICNLGIMLRLVTSLRLVVTESLNTSAEFWQCCESSSQNRGKSFSCGRLMLAAVFLFRPATLTCICA